jgi:2-polyprenyl-6-methoxyphenol hydroxylase-like FAD-dependent oxidoreductase
MERDSRFSIRSMEEGMKGSYDVIIVGARCAGSPTAMLLSRRGHRVLLVDRATFPSDTIVTHVIQPRGVTAFSRRGLLDRLIATGCPSINTYNCISRRKVCSTKEVVMSRVT